MANPFDQFDQQPAAGSPAATGGGNPFDQFDATGEHKDVDTGDTVADFAKNAAHYVGRLGMVGVKGANDAIVNTLSIPLNAIVEAKNAITGSHTQEPREAWRQYSDSTIAPPQNLPEQIVNTGAGFAAGAALPMPGGPAASATGQLADSLAAARGSGYVIPKSAVTGKVGLAEQLMGRKELAADATRQNLKTMSANIAEQFGLPKGTEITHDTMDAVRNVAGKAYEAISSLSPQYAATVERIKSLRSDAQGYYRQISANYDHDVAKKADALWDEAQTLEGQMANNLKPGVTPGLDPKLYENFVAARRTIAQTHDVDKAIINSRGEVNPSTFSKMYGKEKPLSGELLAAGRSAQAFKPAFTSGKSGLLSGWDAAGLSSGVGLGWLGHNDPKLIAAALAAGLGRYGARKLALSGPVQDMALSSSDEKLNALAQALMAAGVANQGAQ